MAKKKRTGKKLSSGSRPAETSSTPSTGGFNRRKVLLGGIALIGGGFGAAGLHAYDTRQRTLHDLSVIGNGTPAVVQLHDPGCRLCRALKAAATEALDGAEDINYRLADITTPEGRRLQDQVQLPHVTLLYFDRQGRMVHNTSGVLEAEEIASDIDTILRQ